MENNELASRVIALRNRKGFSQEFLAEESGLSLRTIQRIENGETQPRGDTLQRIAKGLGVTSEELIDWKLEKDHTYLTILNGSALSFLLFPILGILVPLVMWISKRKQIHKVDEVGKEVINFQITWCLVLFFTFLTFFGGNIYRVATASVISPSLLINPIFLWLALGVLYLLNIFLILFNSYWIRNTNSTKFFLRIPFLR